MTFEEIKAEIKRFKDYAEVEADREKEREWNLGFQEGKFFAYEKCLDLLDSIEPSWHLFPSEKPTDERAYIVTYASEFGRGVSEYKYNERIWEHDGVIAWKERDKPYMA